MEKSRGSYETIPYNYPLNIGRENWVYVAKECGFSATELITIKNELLSYVFVPSSKHSRLDGSYEFGKSNKGLVSIKRRRVGLETMTQYLKERFYKAGKFSMLIKIN